MLYRLLYTLWFIMAVLCWVNIQGIPSLSTGLTYYNLVHLPHYQLLFTILLWFQLQMIIMYIDLSRESQFVIIHIVIRIHNSQFSLYYFLYPLIQVNKKKMEMPCRGIDCKHLQCIDVTMMLRNMRGKLNPLCLICNQPLRKLVIDG